MSSNSPVKNEAWEWIKALLIALALVFIIRWLLFAPFLVSGQSMEPNYFDSERLIVNKVLYDFREPRRGEVIVFLAPDGRDYIKRVIGVPGDRVKVTGDIVYVNGEPIDEPYLKEAIDAARASGGRYNHLDKEETVVQPDTLFVMGDNRSHSSDSRADSVGLVPYDKIVGRTEIVFWPLSHMKLAR